MDFAHLDPSVAMAFYFRDREEFDHFCKDQSEHNAVMQSRGSESRKNSVHVSSINQNTTTQHPKKFDVYEIAKKHYFTLFGIMETMPILPDDMQLSEDGDKKQGEWDIDSNPQENDDDDDEDFFVV